MLGFKPGIYVFYCLIEPVVFTLLFGLVFILLIVVLFIIMYVLYTVLGTIYVVDIQSRVLDPLIPKFISS